MLRFRARVPFVLALPLFACVHHVSPTHRADLSDANTDVYVSDDHHSPAGTRHHVVERVHPVEGRCETSDVEVTEFDHLGQLVGMERYRLRCGVKVSVTVYRCNGDRCTKTQAVDLDRDGYEDLQWQEANAPAPRMGLPSMASTDG